ncbi:MAG: AAA family ATPase [Deltaproteobacteria bacterium]|nr:AAA family ATPase [Deltaproteobacteria bacterium]MBZ0219541.1 AAA family ATPase [Deltaproteobacteria bacterium]
MDSRKLPCLWYQVDEGDGDLATFFYYMGLAGKKSAPKNKKPLPLLTPEYLLGIQTFTRRYFENLYGRLLPRSPSPSKKGTGGVIVFDNYQDAPGQAFHEMMSQALEVIPEGISVVIISRAEPPPQLSRIRAGRKMRIVGWDDIRFTVEETKEMIAGESCGMSDEALSSLQTKTDGWAAGLVLMIEEARRGGFNAGGELKTQGELFDYFASEVFNKTEGSTRDLLLRTSFMQKVAPDMAERLTSNVPAGKILERLSREHFFTQRQGEAYQYHPLFREFLLNLANETFSAKEVSSIQTQTAGLLEERGELEEACGLYVDARAWSDAVRLILAHAPALASQGRCATVNSLIEALPAEVRESDPWLTYWVGICKMAFAPGESRGFLEKAFEQFRDDQDAAGIFLSWASIVDSFNYEWEDFAPLDHWIAVLEELLKTYPVMPSPEIEVRVAAGMLIAIMNRQPGHPDKPVWTERVERAVLETDNVQLKMALGSQLFHACMWGGNTLRCGFLIDKLRPLAKSRECDPLSKQYWYLMESMYSWIVADWSSCHRAVIEGLKNADESGVHLFDLFILANGIYGALSLGQPSFAHPWFERMSRINSPRRGDKGLYHYKAASIAWYDGDLKRSADHALWSAVNAEKMGWPFVQSITLLSLASTYYDDGLFEEAEAALAKSLDLCRGVMPLLECWGSLNGARFAFERGRDKEGAVLLERGLAIAAKCGIWNIPRWKDERMSRLSAKALELGIETEYVKKLIAKRGLVPERPVDGWPYSIRVYTLGRFEIVVDGKPVESQGKVQKKPLDMLKAIIALGGKDVSEDTLNDALWPDADGDAAHKSFGVTLLRLRRLLGTDKALRLQDGLVTLDPAYCWTDIWAFESIAKDESCPGHLFEKAAELYRGDFLPADRNDWSISVRERLRDRFLRLIIRMGKSGEAQGDWESAARYYAKGLKIDNLMEELYQRLMACHKNLGRHAEAVKVYNLCRENLEKHLGISPSARTEALKDGI